VKTFRVNSCHEATRVLATDDLPHLVFADTVLPDGTWKDVLSTAARAPDPVNIIVVARFLDIQLYFETMEHGACDFVMPHPFALRSGGANYVAPAPRE
jgi:DNA-binding NtrC family response regulator